MAKLTVKQLYYGDEYGVMGQVIKSLLQNPPPTVSIFITSLKYYIT